MSMMKLFLYCLCSPLIDSGRHDDARCNAQKCMRSMRWVVSMPSERPGKGPQQLEERTTDSGSLLKFDENRF